MEKKLFSQANLQKSFELVLRQQKEVNADVDEKLEAIEGSINSLSERINYVENRVAVLESYHSGDPIAFAIFSEDDGSLTFYQDNYLPTGAYRGKEVTSLFTTLNNFESDSDFWIQSMPWRPWGEYIQKVVFDESFKNVRLTRMNEYFSQFTNLTEIDWTGLDASDVETIMYMFRNCNSLTTVDLTPFSVAKLSDEDCVEGLFFHCSSLKNVDLSPLDITNATSLAYMLAYCSNLKSVDVSALDTSNVTNLMYMFQGDSNLTTIYSDDSVFVTTQVTIDNGVFSDCTSLVGGNGTTYNSSKLDASMAHIDTASNPGYFTAK